jgi:formylglycine-generating enzyme
VTRLPALLALSLAAPLGCSRKANDTAPTASASRDRSAASPASHGSIGPPEPQPAPRQGMTWIPGGALVAGTPPDLLPRKPDEEMKGEQVILHGYYIDVFPYPNEDGAIPLTNVSHPEAAALCGERGKRLCTELEWERACKGPDNHVYEYGDRHRPDRCGTGVAPSLRPSGLKVGCRSDFGVRDLHGGAFEWTSSPWARGTQGELFTVRGGNSTAGEIVGRCANGEGRPPALKIGGIGFRCCAGNANSAEVVLQVRHGERLDPITRLDIKLVTRLLATLPEDARASLARGGRPRVDKVWTWRPVGNEEFVTASICAGIGVRPACGVLVTRDQLGQMTFVAWASSGYVPPSLHIDRDPRDVWLLGGDEHGRYKRLIAYSWGRVTVHPEDRRVGVPKKERKKKDKKS